MCVANSARSQMAEGLARHIFGSNAQIESAGSNPTQVNSLAITVMKEIGIDISSHHSKSWNEIPPNFKNHLNYVITLCAEEVCPTLDSKAQRLHWPLPDPAGHSGAEEEQLQRFRLVRNELNSRLQLFCKELK